MKKISSTYTQVNGHSHYFSYDYLTKKYQLSVQKDSKYCPNFTNYFNSITVNFNSKKELNNALNNYKTLNHINLTFEHYITSYEYNKYTIRKRIYLKDKSWEPCVNGKYISKNLNNKYCLIYKTKYNSDLYISLEAKKKLDESNIEYHYYYHDNLTHPYKISIYRNTRLKAIKDFEKILELLEIKL